MNMTTQQHAKLAQHYHNRHFQIACTQIINKYPAKQVVMDYHAIYQKYLYHKRAAADLRAAEAQRQTEVGLLALGVVAPESDSDWCHVCHTELGRGQCLDCREERYQQRDIRKAMMETATKPVVVGRLNVGDVLALNNRRFEIITLPEAYQRNTIAAFKVATVKDVATGEQSEMKLYANQRYNRVEVL